ncbi:MAG: hypothetical protein KY397_00285 [Gemmatimonadetes bacterium]|nr:hypothetical protein [Gemmatimonadota bacterium]
MSQRAPLEIQDCTPSRDAPGDRRNEDGQDLAEYAILIGLIALVVVGAVALFGDALVAMYNDIVATLPFS